MTTKNTKGKGRWENTGAGWINKELGLVSCNKPMKQTKKTVEVLEPIYTRKKVWKHIKICPSCKEELVGDGSNVNPYKCSCGVWMQDWFTAKWSIIPSTSWSNQ